jgi:diguanylate cyclase (GGDEF)-like protein/PAS domain S-box-containing protein
MVQDAVPAHFVPLSVLVVAPVRGESALLARVDAVGAQLRTAHALTLPAALAALADGAFDCVLADVGPAGAAATEVTRALRDRTGAAGLVVVVRVDGPASSDLHELADLVLTPDDLDGTWLRALRRTAEHARLRAELHETLTSMARLSSIVDSVADAVFTTDADGTVTTWNDGARLLYGYTADQMVGADVAMLHPPGSDEPRRILAMSRAGESIRGLETIRRTRDGRMARVSLSVTPLTDDGRLSGLVVLARDIGDRLELEAELVRQTMNDALTRLPNRAYLTYRLTQSLAEAHRSRRPLAVLVIDLDQFKAIDDVHGHLAGDRVLAEVADRLRDLARPTDIVARLGGDEFVVVCPDTDHEAAGRIAERVIQVIAAPLEVDGRGIRVGASVGIAVSSPLERDADTMLKHADAAMYEAKARGRARSQLFDPMFARRADERRRLAGDLREALAQGQLDVHYQPVIDLATDRVVGVEALARWRHPYRGAVPPGTFVPLAETHGFVAELDHWVLRRACRETAERQASGGLPATAQVAVNLSARSLDDPRLVDRVGETLRRSGLRPESLVLEVTETALLQNREVARTSLEGLRDLGAGISLDDFGTGYSSLSFLRELPVTAVKIDRSFVHNAADRPEDLAITEAIVRLANGLGLATIAEGIETVEQRDLLRRLGCASGQGFWWSAAVPMDTIAGDDAATPPAPVRDPHPAPYTPVRRAVSHSRRRVAVPAVEHRTVCCLRAGLDAGQAWLVVASANRREAFARTLGPLHAAAVSRGQLVELDAYDTLRRVAGPDSRLDGDRFDRVVGAALRRLGATSEDVGVHAELGHVNQPLPSQGVSTDLHQKLHTVSTLSLAYGDHLADCAAHGPLPARLVVIDDSTAS